MTLLSVQRLSKRFGGVHAVDDVSFTLERGELLGMIGPNGAGKSTCFNIINGQLPPDGGRVLVEDFDIVGMPPRKIWRLGVGRTFQVAATFASLTALENVQVALISKSAHTFRLWRPAKRLERDRARALLAQVGMEAHAETPCSLLAYGDVKRVELAIALANDPKLLLMDEPTAGMAPRERHAMMTLTRDLARRHNVGVLFTEHSMDVIFGYADRVIVLARGRLIADGQPEHVRADQRVRQLYFGASPGAIERT